MRLFSLPLVAVLLAACAGEPTSPSAAAAASFTTVTHSNLRDPINTATFQVFNPCTEEWIVDAVGIGHARFTTLTEDGTTRTKGSINFQNIVGYGETSGIEYRLISNQRTDQTFDIVEGGSLTLRVNFRAITPGPTDNFFLDVVLVLSFPPGLAPVVVVSEITPSCRG